MTRRKGEITLPEIKRKWTHHVVLQADKVRGVRNSENRLGVWSITVSGAAAVFAAPSRWRVRSLLFREAGRCGGVL
jgi:hypothetical protein